MYNAAVASPSARSYYWEICKRFGQECYRTWRQDLFIGVVIAAVILLLTRHDKSALEQFLVFVEATGIVFALFVLFHLARTPFTLHHEQVHRQGWPQVHWKFGVLGFVLLISLVSAVAYRLIKPWLYSLPNITIILPVPPPQENSAQPQPVQNRPTSQSPKTTTRLATPQTAQPINPAPSFNLLPQTQLDRVLLLNRNLAKPDRDRLAEALYEFSQSLEHGLSLMYRLNSECNLNAENTNIAKDYQSRITKLREISPLTAQYAKDFLALRTKYEYYREQTEYVFGDNPDNLGPNSLTNGAEGFANYLERWSAIPNKDNKDVLSLLSEGKNDCNTRIMAFSNWYQGCKARLEQMKASIQVSSSSNLQIPRTAPAVQMF